MAIRVHRVRANNEGVKIKRKTEDEGGREKKRNEQEAFGGGFDDVEHKKGRKNLQAR